MAKKKNGIENDEIANFINNVTTSFEGQRNTLNFVKKLGNVDAGELILHAAEKEVYFVIERMKALHKMEKEEAPLSEATISGVNQFMSFLYEEVKSDLDGLDYDLDELIANLELTYHQCA